MPQFFSLSVCARVCLKWEMNFTFSLRWNKGEIVVIGGDFGYWHLTVLHEIKYWVKLHIYIYFACIVDGCLTVELNHLTWSLGIPVGSSERYSTYDVALERMRNIWTLVRISVAWYQQTLRSYGKCETYPKESHNILKISKTYFKHFWNVLTLQERVDHWRCMQSWLKLSAWENESEKVT